MTTTKPTFKMISPLVALLGAVLSTAGCEMVSAEGETIEIGTLGESEAEAQARALAVQSCETLKPKKLFHLTRYEGASKKYFLVAEVDNPDAQRALGLQLAFAPNDNSPAIYRRGEPTLLREGAKAQLVSIAKSDQRMGSVVVDGVVDVTTDPYFAANVRVSLCSAREKQDLAFYAEAGRQYTIERSRNKLIWKKAETVANPENKLVWRASNPVVGDEVKGVEYFRVKVSCTTNFDCRNENKRLDESTDEIRRLYK